MSSPAPRDNGGDDGRQLPTSEEQLEAIGTGTFSYITIFTLVLFNVSYGMEILVTNICFRAMPHTKWGMTDQDRANLVAIAYLGFIIGAFVSGYLADKFGRKPIITIHSLIFVPFTIWSALSFDLATVYLTRFVVGISEGVMLPVAVSLIAELAVPSRRGTMIIAVPGIGFVAGEFVVLLVGLVAMGDQVECEDDCGWWRWVFLSGIIPDIIAWLIMLFYIPESPRYLLLVGETEEAEKAIRQIAIANGAEDCLLDSGRIAPLQPDTRKVSSLELLQPPICWDFFAIVIAWTLFGMGIFGINFLVPILLETDYHYNAQWQFSLLLIFVLAQGISCIFLIWVIDMPDVGRLFLVMSLCLLVVPLWAGAGFAMGQSLLVVGPLALVGMAAANSLYQCFYVYAAERMPTSHRALGIGAANGLSKLSAVAGPIILAALLAHAPHGATFLTLAGSVAVGAAVIFMSSPTVTALARRGSTETLGKRMTDHPDDELGPTERTPLL